MRNETIFEFIRFAIDNSQTVFGNLDDMDWIILYDFAKKQTIAGVLFAGIEKLPKEQRPPKAILMNWYMNSIF